jgi:hypothetical protein
MKVDQGSSSGREGPSAAANAIDWDALERLIRRDPGGRGVASYVHQGQPLLPAHVRRAAESLAQSAQAVAIVTGFAIVTPEGVAAETDGPPGALFLSQALRELDIEVILLSDAYGVPVLHAGCDCWGLPREMVREIPFEHPDPGHASRQSNDSPHNARTDTWVNEFLDSPRGTKLTHLIAIERVGPSLVAAPLRDASASLGETRPRDAEHANVCHNMRGESINRYTAKAHRLFEIAAERRLPITTIGIGDGGNEIGLGTVPHDVLCQAIAKGPAERIICRIATAWTILAGVSNWGGYALALATVALKDRSALARLPDEVGVRKLVECLVRDSFCVDGVTKRREASVDGLALDEELGILRALRQSV